jgi:hypothetical protein
LSGANFWQAIFRECDATDAKIEGAKFRDADMRTDGLVLQGTKIDDETDFEIENHLLPDFLPRELRDAAARARGARRWRHRKSYSWSVQALM